MFFTILSILLTMSMSLSAQSEGETVSSKEETSVNFDFLSPDPIKLEPPDTSVIVLSAEIINLGDEKDSYDMFKNEDLPSAWNSAFCIEGGCLRPDMDSLKAFVSLEPMEKETVSVHISPNGEIGGGTVTLTVRSNEEPSNMRSLKVVGITYGTDVLVVDDDGEHDYERYYADALGNDVTYGTWIRCCKEITSDDLEHFNMVLWETGDTLPALTPSDRTAIAQYLEGGGNLFISGQDIGWSLCYPQSPDYTQASCDFYQDYLHVNYVSNSASDVSLTGVFGDAISHGLEISIAGGDGAHNQTSPSVISAIAPAKEVFKYDASQVGAIRIETGTYKLVYFAFGFEAINDEGMRNEIMKNILNRFTYDGEKGDVDNNGSINVLDVISAANIILTILDPLPDQWWRADFDNNDQVNVLDLIGIVNVILGGGMK